MTAMIVELYEALRAAGAPEEKAQAAAKAMADHERRFDRRRYRAGYHPWRNQSLGRPDRHRKVDHRRQFADILALILRTFVAV